MEPQRAIALVADGINLAVGDRLNIADPTRLRNPLNAPMWMDSITFTQRYLDGDTGAFGLGDLMVRCFLGQEPLTNGMVPVATLDRIPNTSRRATGTLNQTTIPALGSYSYTWRFKKPLFVPAGGYVVTELWNTGATANDNYTNLVVTYRGRSLPKDFVPDEIHIPWCAAYVGAVADLTDAALTNETIQTKKTDLLNPFDVPVKIERMTGLYNVDGYPSFAYTSRVLMFDQEYILIRLTDSTGGIIVRDPTPMGHLFQILDAAWQFNGVIQPKQHYIAMLNLNFADFIAAFTHFGSGITNGQPFVAISGYRSLPYGRVKLA